MSRSQSARRAYSYVRFSTVQQAEGGSLSRQTALSQAYCKRKKLHLDDSLTLCDLGVSAFRGNNVRDGALAGFLEACRVGRVPKGSYLIVESLDRLSRDQIRPALQLFLALQDYGITIVTLQPEREYPPEATDALALIEPLIVFARAHEESMIKSHRRRDGWKQARERARQGGGPIMKTCPGWLEVTPDGFRVKEEAAAVVRRIYELARDGLGVHRIVDRLGREGAPSIGTRGRWVKGYVYRILSNPAAMGAYQPNRQDGKKVVPDGPPIPNHYPAVITEEEWQETQAALQLRTPRRLAGRKGAEETNLFTGLLRCALTGERLHIAGSLGRKGAAPRKRYVYLAPTQVTAVPRGCRIDYGIFEAAVLSLLKELRPLDVAPVGGKGDARQAEISRLSGRLLDIDTRLERVRQRARTSGDFDAFLDLIEELHAERKQVSEKQARLEQERDARTQNDLCEAQSLIDMLDEAPAAEREDLRRRLKGRIGQLVQEGRVVIVRRGKTCLCALQLFFRGGDRRRDYLILHKPGTRYGEGHWWCRSLTSVIKPGGLDLRVRDHARRLEEALQAEEIG
jgi:DNA invertase Pin-like site-specific DNA recombinase